MKGLCRSASAQACAMRTTMIAPRLFRRLPPALAAMTALVWPAGERAPAAAEPVVDAKAMPRIRPVEAGRALATFQLREGFRLEQVAAEPLVVDPVEMAFDEDGRLFVAEMPDYPERSSQRLGLIRRLEDTDGDGRFDKATVFARDLAWPTAIFTY